MKSFVGFCRLIQISEKIEKIPKFRPGRLIFIKNQLK